jgi:hypothetical protein
MWWDYHIELQQCGVEYCMCYFCTEYQQTSIPFVSLYWQGWLPTWGQLGRASLSSPNSPLERMLHLWKHIIIYLSAFTIPSTIGCAPFTTIALTVEHTSWHTARSQCTWIYSELANDNPLQGHGKPTVSNQFEKGWNQSVCIYWYSLVQHTHRLAYGIGSGSGVGTSMIRGAKKKY